MRNSKNKQNGDILPEDYFAAFDLQPEFIYIIEPETFKVVHVNKAIRDFYNGEPALGKPCHSVYMNSDTPCPNCPVVSYLKTGERRFSQKKRPDGMTVLAGASPIKWQGKDYMLITGTDITKLKDEIDDEREFYREAVLTGSLCSYQADLTDNMIYQTPIFNAPEYQTDGLDFPMNYDSYITMWNVKYDIVHEAHNALYLQSAAALIQSFENGERNLHIDYKLKYNDSYRRKMILISKRKGDGHIIANVVIYDTTESSRMLFAYQKFSTE